MCVTISLQTTGINLTLEKGSNWYLVKPSDNCLAIVNNYPGLGLTQL